MATPTPTSGTATPFELDPEQAAQSLKVSLADLSAKAAAQFAHKNYDEAAEMYAQAAEMQAEMNGEMSPDNAEILFMYGRALFKVGQSKSDVLGGRAPEAKKQQPKPKPKPKTATNESASSAAQTKVENSDAAASTDAAAVPDVEKKPLFHFEGDENFDDSEEDEDAEEAEGEEEEEDDDLATAFEILDLARVLFVKKLEATPPPLPLEDDVSKGKEAADGEDYENENADSPAAKHIKERLADAHDLLAEISLENERYPRAIHDSRESLRYKKELYPEESEIIAEAHFKLSLALEFASVTKSSDDAAADNKEAGEGDNSNGTLDQGLRDEAAAELEAAIASTRLKLQNKEVELATMHNPEDNDILREQITDVKDIIADMELRLIDLKKPPIDINSALGLPTGSAAKAEPQVTDEVKKNANDLTGLVRKKRKAEDVPAAEEGVEAKKVKEGEAEAAS
ncbi:hypothetical protein B0T17DRAFT_587173 [Bombardia bombarda]|uniref:Tetratricopeptide SHNi-TPR domain-containing protein n=1 Tax=Bombardia bombarda TaxID=252184 RepID=A0AA39XM66_9PEZI|nr:hypothetical protein B0T17DRAFT_587173 [Bombardia bombarda]